MLKLLHVGLSAGDNPPNGLQEAFKKEFEYRDINTGTPGLNAKIVQMAKEFVPDICFIQVQKGGVIENNTLKELKNLRCYTINFTGDVRHPIPDFYYKMAQVIDVTLFSNDTDVTKMRADGFNAKFLELGINEKIYSPHGNKLPSNRIVFFGNNYGEGYFPLSKQRIDMVKFMKDKFGTLFSLYGNGWKEFDGNYNSSQPNEAAAYRWSEIAINLSHFNYDNYSSDRLLRILGTGTMCLTHEYENIDKRFIDGTHLVAWKSFEELEGLCWKYLDNPEEREVIANAGRELCHNNYTFTHMIKNIKKIYDER